MGTVLQPTHLHATAVVARTPRAHVCGIATMAPCQDDAHSVRIYLAGGGVAVTSVVPRGMCDPHGRAHAEHDMRCQGSQSRASAGCAAMRSTVHSAHRQSRTEAPGHAAHANRTPDMYEVRCACALWSVEAGTVVRRPWSLHWRAFQFGLRFGRESN